MATLRNSLFNNAYEQIYEEVHAAITKFKNTKYPTLHVLDIDDWGQDLSLRYSRTHAFTIKYVPGVDFTGEDYLEVTNKASNGDANFYITSIDKYTITVTE